MYESSIKKDRLIYKLLIYEHHYGICFQRCGASIDVPPQSDLTTTILNKRTQPSSSRLIDDK